MKIPATMPFVQEETANRFWIIGDVHGMVNQFQDLLFKIADYEIALGKDGGANDNFTTKIVFIGDICDRGEDSLQSLHLMLYLRGAGFTQDQLLMPFFNVLGNHDEKLLRALNGNKVQPKHGLDTTLFQIAGVDEHTRNTYKRFLATTPLTIKMVAPTQTAVAVHAAFYPHFYGYGMVNEWGPAKTMEYAIYGPVRSVSLEGKPDRIDWENNYDGEFFVFYGHKIVGDVPKFSKKACGVDTGCFQSGILTAVSFPDLVTLQVIGKPSSIVV